jgi:hypothetical protein
VNEDQIEKALRNAPQPAPPPDLRERLEQQIRVPAGNVDRGTRPPWFVDWRRPLLGWAALLIAVMVIGVQSHQVGQLRRDNEQLLKTVAAIEELHEAALRDERIPRFQQEVEQLRRQNVELHQLRAEVTRLRGEVRQIEPLRTEIKDLQARLAAAVAAAPTAIPEEEFEIDPEKANEMNCINQLKQIGVAATPLHEQAKGSLLPSDFLAIAELLGTPRLLRCPSDTGRIAAESWNQFIPSVHATYEFVSGDAADGSAFIARCPIHRLLVSSNGRVSRHAEGMAEPSGFEFGPESLPQIDQFMLERYGVIPSRPVEDPGYYDRLMMERYGIDPTRPPAQPTDPQ